MLRSLNLSRTYESEEQHLLNEFYIPALSASREYWRASAYFSSASLFVASKGFSKLLQNDGKIKLLLGNELTQRDYEAISEGYKMKERSEKLLSDLYLSASKIENLLFHKRMQAISWLIENEKIEIKIAFRQTGIFHKKIGILFDDNNDAISFDGSSNETAAAFQSEVNSEQLSIFPSWDENVREYFQSHKRQFENYWDKTSINSMTSVYKFEEADNLRLINVIQEAREKTGITEQHLNDFSSDEFEYSNRRKPSIPHTINGHKFELKEHQKEALNNWRSKGRGIGILALATGAGKTITSIYGAVKLYQQAKNLFLVIAVPYQNLADQWLEVLRTFGINAIPCYRNTALWKENLQSAIDRYNAGVDDFVSAVVVNRSLNTDNFQVIIKQVVKSKHFMFIGDECHHHSSVLYSSSLPRNAEFRIGLSATPEHYLDEEKNISLSDYYGQIVANYTLIDAINDKVLTPYNYHVVPVKLEEDEFEEYLSISTQISKLSFGGENLDNPSLTALLMKRSRLLGSARGKIIKLKEILRNANPEAHTLFYCGDGMVEDNSSKNGESRQIEVVTKIASENGFVPSRFTANENLKQRRHILEGFKDGSIKSLVAIKCLDEGIDIPACKTAFILASSANPRQFVQRRGRILRKSEGKDIARIYDFIVYADEGDKGEKINHKSADIMRNELKRVTEFASVALNKHETYNDLRPILVKYGLVGLI